MHILPSGDYLATKGSTYMSNHDTPGAGGSIQHLHPAGLHYNPAYTNVVVVTGPATTIYIGAQGPLDAQGNLVGKGDIGAQTDQALQNVQTALAAAGAQLEHVIK